MSAAEQPPRPKLPSHRIRAVAVAAEADPRTVRRLIAGERVLPMQRERIERALHQLGLANLITTPVEIQP
jgi:hypothetical protein